MALDPTNPFAAVSALDHLLPPFADIEEGHFLPAFVAGMAEQRDEVAVIAADPAAPTAENTLEALERSGALLTRVSKVFYNLTGSVETEALRAVEAEVTPLLTAHRDAILMDPALFVRLAALADTGRLGARYHLDAVRAGAALGREDQERLRAINGELARLGTQFRNRLSDDTNDLAVHVTDPAELDGLAPDAVDSAAAAARARGLDGHLLTLVLPTRQPATSSLRHRGLRERVHLAATSRGRRGNDHDTRAIVLQVTALRAERAALLGYPTHADFTIADQTAGTPGAVREMLGAMVAPAVANARAEAAVLTERLHADGFDGPLQAWDWPYYAAREAAAASGSDPAALRPWFELDRVVTEGVFAAATALYGLRFAPRPDLPAYHPDVRVYEVFDGEIGAPGSGSALFLADWYARDSKRGGAWMSTFVDQSHLLGHRPVVVINLNVPRPPEGSPTLLTLDEVTTAFHEFGHVLHGLLSDVEHPRLSGTSVPRDFVEYPSQVNEMWAFDPALLARYAVHHGSGEPLPADALAQLTAGEDGQGYATVEMLAAALLDLAWHEHPADAAGDPEDVDAFERDVLTDLGLVLDPALGDVPPRYGSSYFAHVFAGGYSAGYYSYLWSEVLDADTVDWFTEHGGLLAANGTIFRRELLSRGGTVDPMAAFAAVVGRPPRTGPLLARRGLLPS